MLLEMTQTTGISTVSLLICIFLVLCQHLVLGFGPQTRTSVSFSSTRQCFTSPFSSSQQTLCRSQRLSKEVLAICLTSLSFTSASFLLSSPCNPILRVPVAQARVDATGKSAFDALKEARNELVTILKADPGDEIYDKTKKGLKKLLSKSNVMLSLKIINKPEVKITQYKSAVVHGLAAIDNLDKEDLKEAEKELSAFISIVQEKEAKAEKAAMFLFN